MKTIFRFYSVLVEIWKNLNKFKKKLFLLFILISLIITVLDLISITLLMDAVGYATNNEFIIKEKISIYYNFDEYSDKKLFLFICASFVFISASSILIKYVHTFVSAKIAYGIIYDFNQKIFNRLVYLNLLNNKNINVNTATATLAKVEEITKLVASSLAAVSAFIVSVGILVALLFIDAKLTFYSGSFLLFSYFIMIYISKKKLTENGKNISENINLKINTLSSLLSNRRNIILDNLREMYIRNFSKFDYKIYTSNTSNHTISYFPSILIINSIFIAFVIYLNFLLSTGSSFVDNIPKLTAIAFGAQKLNPLINQIFVAFTRNEAGYYNVLSIFNFLKKIQKKPNFKYESTKYTINSKDLGFQKKIRLEKIFFKYQGGKKILANLNLIISKNDKILISGASGSGKSTFLDILTGLIRPNKGKIIIDGRSIIGKNNLNLYQKKISLIDQNIFIEEGSLLKNITKSDNVSEVNQKLLIKCCKIAELDDLIKKNKDKYKMYLSHLGTNLSGGQKQRVAIARSIYNNRDILILDETTSEIDPKTENKIFNNFKKHLKDKTILMITHRTKKINFFNKKFELKNNKLKKIY